MALDAGGSFGKYSNGPTKGAVMVIGGGETRCEAHDPDATRIENLSVLKNFIELTHKKNPVIHFITTASEKYPTLLFEEYQASCKRLGVDPENCIHVDIGQHVRNNEFDQASFFDSKADQARSFEIFEDIKYKNRMYAALAPQADAFFFTGGNQQRACAMLNKGEYLKAVHEQNAQGKIVVGTSAGAMLLGEDVIIPGQTPCEFSQFKGTGFVENTIFETHRFREGRWEENCRISGATLQNGFSGISLAENTAAIIYPDQSIKIVGPGKIIDSIMRDTVVVIDRTRGEKPITTELRAGDQYNFSWSRPILASKKAEQENLNFIYTPAVSGNVMELHV